MHRVRPLKFPLIMGLLFLVAVSDSRSSQAQSEEAESSVGHRHTGMHLFERETFGGNGRTCLTCHSRQTGTVSQSLSMLISPVAPVCALINTGFPSAMKK